MSTMNTKSKGLLVGMLAMMVAASLSLAPNVGHAKSKRYTNTDEYCEGETNGKPNPCGALVIADATTNYYINKVDVNARGTQSWDNNSNCTGVTSSNTMDLRASEYGVFILPAPCSYKLEIHIGGGDTKHQDVFLTPGCEIVLQAKGTTLSDNKPKVDKIVWTDEAKEALGVTNSDPVDDRRYHQALAAAGVPEQAGVVHYCNKDGSADKDYNN